MYISGNLTIEKNPICYSFKRESADDDKALKRNKVAINPIYSSIKNKLAVISRGTPPTSRFEAKQRHTSFYVIALINTDQCLALKVLSRNEINQGISICTNSWKV